jgi:hypothetical protein
MEIFSKIEYTFHFPHPTLEAIILTNLPLFYARMLSCKIKPFWINNSFKRIRFLNGPNLFLHFYDYLPLEEDMALYLNKLEFPSP